MEPVNLPFYYRQVAQVSKNVSNRTTRVYGGTEDPIYIAMLGGHSTLNTVVLGEGMSKYQIHTPHSGVFKTAGGAKKNVKKNVFFCFICFFLHVFLMSFLYSDFSNVSVI
jgi:hypothetical protein